LKKDAKRGRYGRKREKLKMEVEKMESKCAM
jgi:hypothetical protein